METIQTLLFVLQVLVAVGLIGFILIQHGKGADAGAAFGSGASQTVFGSSGSGNFLTKTTAVLAFVFLANSLILAWIATQRVQENTSLMEEQSVIMLPEEEINEDLVIPETSDIPAVPEIPDSTASDVPDIPVE